jgi:8-oxo-dGTP pyrophosphatase MutT (NUDIX family)
MQWRVHTERSLYSDEWLDLRVADVELPDGRHLEHRLLRMPPSAGAVALDEQHRALLIWRHRFITGLWGWEIPMGRVGPGETPAQAAAREAEEETGWRPGPLRPLIWGQPTAGIMDAPHHLFTAQGATKIGDPVDAFEAARCDWVPLTDVPALIAKREIVSITAMAALLHLLTTPPA